MEHQQQAGKNFAWLSIAQFATRLFGAAFYFFLSHKLLAEGIGEYSFVSSFVPLWLLVTDFGAGSYLYREWSKSKADKENAARDYNILFSSTSIITLAIFLAFLFVNYFINRGIYLSLILFFITMYISGYVHINDLFLQSGNIFRQPAIRQVLEKMTVIVFGVAFLLWRPKVYMVFFAILLSQIISYAYYFFAGFAFPLHPAWNWRRTLELFKKGIPFLLIGIFSTIYARIDMVMLRYMSGFEAVGLYGAAYKFLDVASIFALLFTASIFPVLSVLNANPDKVNELKSFFSQALRITFAVGLVTGLALIFAAPLLFHIFFPSSFGQSVLALRILTIAQVTSFLSQIFGTLVIIKGKEKNSLYILLACALFNIGLNFLLIPKYSFYGSAWATVIAEFLNLYLLQRAVTWHKNWPVMAKMALLAAVDTAGLLLLKHWALLNSLSIGALVLLFNAGVIYRIGLLQKEDLKLFYDPFKQKFNSLWLKVSQLLSVKWL